MNLFDPKLHTVAYVRNKSKFLFTTMIMACCKYFKPEMVKTLQAMCQTFASRSWDEQEKSVEVVQAFSCLTYWKELEDNVSLLPFSTWHMGRVSDVKFFVCTAVVGADRIRESCGACFA